MSDPDRQRAYAAEDVVRKQLECSVVTVAGATVTIPVERRFARLEDVQRYVDLVLALGWVRAAYPEAARPLRVERGRVINEASCGHGVMRLNDSAAGRWMFRELVILHELAHHLAPRGHGVEWRSCYLHLLEELVAPEAAWLLRVAYYDQGLHASVYT